METSHYVYKEASQNQFRENKTSQCFPSCMAMYNTHTSSTHPLHCGAYSGLMWGTLANGPWDQASHLIDHGISFHVNIHSRHTPESQQHVLNSWSVTLSNQQRALNLTFHYQSRITYPSSEFIPVIRAFFSNQWALNLISWVWNTFTYHTLATSSIM